MKTPRLLIAPLVLVSFAAAQTQLVRGDIDGIQGTNRFQLDCTQIPLISSTVNLQALHDQSRNQDIEYEMMVVNVGTAAQPVLDVRSAVAIPEIFDMGNLRFGRSESWEVFGTPGSETAVYIGLRSGTRYGPLGPLGTWVLGAEVLPMASGTIGAAGRFRFEFTMPTIPQAVGIEFTSQAIVAEPSGLLITNPDCKEVENN